MDQYNRNEQTGNGAFTGETNGKDHEYRERPGRVRRSVNDSAEMRSSLSRGGQVNQPNSSQVQYQSSAAAPYGGQYANTSPARNRQGSLVSPGGISNGYGTAQTANSPNGYGAVQAASNPNGYGGPQSAGSLNGYGGPQTAGNLNAYKAQQGAINPNGYTAAQQSSASANGYAGQKYAGGQYSGGQPRSAGQQALNGQYAQTNQSASNRNAYTGQQLSAGQNAYADSQSQSGTQQAAPIGSRQTNPAENIPAPGRQRNAAANTPYTRDRNRSAGTGESRVRDRRLPSEFSLPETDISAAARKRQSEVIYGDALQTEVPTIKGTPSLYLRGTDGENRKVSVPFTDDLLSRHVMLLGGIGTGKTNAFFQMIDQLKYTLTDDDIMVIFDTKGDFYQEFFEPGDVVISNDRTSVGPNGHRNYWNIFNEVNHDYEYESVLEISKSLFAEECKRTTQIFFPNAARDIFMACFLHFLRSVPAKERTNKNLAAYINSSTSADLREMIESYPDLRAMTSYISKDDSAQTQGVLSELQQVIRNIFVGNFAKTGNLGLSRLVRAKGGKKIFIEYDLSLGEMLTPIYSLMFDMAIKQALGRSRSEGNVYFITDEFRLLPNLVHIDDAVNFGRSLGIKFMIGIQNVEQIFENYGEYRARSILSGFLSSFNFRVNDARSREYIKDLFGRNRKLEAYVPIVQNRGMVEEQREACVVEDWDMTNLGIGQAIIGLPGYEPFILQFDRFESGGR